MAKKGHGKYADIGLGPVKPLVNGKTTNPYRLYRIWTCMKVRVRRPPSYLKQHAGEGYLDIKMTICEEWLDFRNFWLWAMSHGYRDDLSLDRINNLNGCYCPENCRWATHSEQSKNRRMTDKMRKSNGRNARLGGLASAEKRRKMKVGAQ